MRLSGKKFADRFVEKRIRPTSETRDGIIFSIDWDEYVCKCKIQGSDEYVNAHFPRNRATIPRWMKPGNAVRLLHRQGQRGYVEVIGNGGAIPTPMLGSPSHPAVEGIGDGIISGLQVTAAGGMKVHISAGTYRISGVVYEVDGNEAGYPIMSESSPVMTMDESYPPAVMGDPAGINYITMDESDPPMTMNEIFPPAVMGVGDADFTLDPLSPDTAGQFRYDTFQVGTDGIIDYVKGTQSYGTAPTKPAIDGGHVQIRPYILIVGTGDVGTTEITGANIGWEWTTPIAVGIDIVAPTDLYYNQNYADITVTVINQYGYKYVDPREYVVQLVRGTGTLDYAGESTDDTLDIFDSSGDIYFQYTRDKSACVDVYSETLCETCPSIRVAVYGEGGPGVSGGFEDVIFIQLWNEAGFKMDKVGSNTRNVKIYEQSSSGSITLDWDDGYTIESNLFEDITSVTLTGGENGDRLLWILRQDSTGGWEVTLPSNVKYGDQITAVNLSISTTANSRTYLGFIYDASSSSYDLVANVSGYV